MTGMAPEAVARELQRTADSIGKSIIPAFLQQAKVAIVADTRENFKNSAGPDGQSWPGLAMPRPRGGNKPLMDTGILRASVVSGGEGHVERITPTSLTMGTSLPRAAIHQEGGTIVPTKSKALAIPLTNEARRAGSPRRFPRPLTLLWRAGADSGVLAEVDKKKLKATRGDKAAAKAIRQYTPKQRAIVTKIKKLTAKAKRDEAKGRATNATQAKIWAEHKKLKILGRNTARKARQRQASRAARRDAAVKVQYALVKSVTIPPRPFLGFGPRLVKRLDEIMARSVRRAFLNQPTAGA